MALLALAFSGVSCAKHDSVAERNAEIDRRIDERLTAREEAAAKQRLAQQQAELAAREKVLEAREASFANLIASVPATPEPAAATEPPTESTSSLLASDSYLAPQSYSTYPEASGPASAEPYGYVTGNAPFYADPYLCPPTTAFVTVINQNAVIVNPRRNFRRPGMGQTPRGNQPAPPAVGPANPLRPPVISRPPVRPRPPVIVRQPTVPRSNSIGQRLPVPTAGQRPTRSTGAPPVAPRRVAAKPALAQTR